MNKFINQNFDQMVADLITWVNIPSILGEPSEQAPFGKEIGNAIAYMETLAQSMGFVTKNYDGYALEITAGTGEYIIGILGHTDVVPVGDDWDTNPFDAQIIDGRLVGRGASDDKGPMMSCLYAMKYLKDNDLIPGDKQLRMIIGTDEEELWRGIRYYIEQAEKLPDIGFTPDGDFPVIYAEKGLLDFDLCYPITSKDSIYHLESIEGGQSRNSVPAHVTFVIRGENFSQLDTEYLIGELQGVELQVEAQKITGTVKGVTVHAMQPEKGENAFAKAMLILSRLGTELDAYDFVNLYNRYLSNDFHGEKLGIFCEDQVSGKLSFNDGGIRYEEQCIRLACNLRYPVEADYEELKRNMQARFANMGMKYTEVEHLSPVYFEKDSKLIQTLMSVYRDVTHDMTEPIATSGASYARAMENIVCFGPIYTGQEEVAHEANEYIELEKYKEMTSIYIQAILGLMK